MQTEPIQIDLTDIDVATPEGWEAFNTSATVQWLSTCDEDERAEYFDVLGIQLGAS